MMKLSRLCINSGDSRDNRFAIVNVYRPSENI